MPLFDFDDGPLTFTIQSSLNTGLTEDGVNFVFTAAGNPGNENFVASSVINQIVLSDASTGGNWTLDLSAGSSNSGFVASGLSLGLGSFLFGSWDVVFQGDVSNVTVAVTGLSQVITPVAGANTSYSSIQFVSSSNNANISIDSLNATLMCYCAGTGIATPHGDVAVETLKTGDTVLTADGRETKVTWLGRQPVDTRLTHPAKVNPICISAGALAEGVPARDLFVSPDHALEIDGTLYQASALVNGRSIRVVESMPREGFTYYHVETAAHELLLAENCPAESFIEMGDLADGFINRAERPDAAPLAEMDLPRIATRRLVPADLKARLDARAERLAQRFTHAA